MFTNLELAKEGRHRSSHFCNPGTSPKDFMCKVPHEHKRAESHI